MFRAALIDVYNTTRKVYAEGARASEVPLPRPESALVNSGKAKVDPAHTRKERRRMFRKMRMAVPGYAPLCMDSNDPDTVECAFKQRLLRDVPSPDPATLKRFHAFVKQYLKDNVKVATPITFMEWLASTSYNEQRKAQLNAANNENNGGRPSKRHCSRVSAFIKSEFYPTWKHARMINSRSDHFKAWSGPLFKSIEKVVYDIPEFIKHIPVPDRPNHIKGLKQAGMRYFATDFTAYESHFSPEIMNMCECELYRHCLQWSNDREFLCSVIMGKNLMKTRSGCRAEVTGRRMSGDMCTSLGNGFTNLMLAKFVAHEQGAQLYGFVEGDDGIFATTALLNENTYAKLGFTIKIEEVDDPCLASFCGMVFSNSGEIIKEPRKFMMGFGWTQSFINAGPKIMDELLRAKALSCVYETPQCPVVGAFARRALELTASSHPRFVQDGFHILPDVINVPDFEPSMDTREVFSKLYGVSIDAQLAIEQAVMNDDLALVSTLLPPTAEQLLYSELFVVPT